MGGSARAGTGRFLHKGGSLCLRGTFWRALLWHPPLPAPTAEQQGEEESFLPPPALQVMAVLRQSRLAGEKLPRTSLGSIWIPWGKGEPTAHTLGHLGNAATGLPNKACVPNGVNVKAGAVEGIHSHQQTCSSTRRWWCLGLCGDSNTDVSWGKCIHAEKAPQLLLPLSLHT